MASFVVFFIFSRILRNLCLPYLVTIDLVERSGKGFVLDGWERNKFEFVRFFLLEDELTGGFGDCVHEQGGRCEVYSTAGNSTSTMTLTLQPF